jgi:hypothetical protein
LEEVTFGHTHTAIEVELQLDQLYINEVGADDLMGHPHPHELQSCKVALQRVFKAIVKDKEVRYLS